MPKRRVLKHKGKPCKIDCSGHRAGYRYARSGGTKFSPYSSSFNEGMSSYNRPKKKK